VRDQDEMSQFSTYEDDQVTSQWSCQPLYECGSSTSVGDCVGLSDRKTAGLIRRIGTPAQEGHHHDHDDDLLMMTDPPTVIYPTVVTPGPPGSRWNCRCAGWGRGPGETRMFDKTTNFNSGWQLEDKLLCWLPAQPAAFPKAPSYAGSFFKVS
jgi:hypothetical protein